MGYPKDCIEKIKILFCKYLIYDYDYINKYRYYLSFQNLKFANILYRYFCK